MSSVKLGDRGVGDGFEGGADAALLGVDPSDQVDVDLAMERGDEVGQRVVRAPEVDRAAQGLLRERRGRGGEAVDRAFGALIGGELDPGADGPDVVLGQELRMGQADDRLGDVGVVALGVVQHRFQGRVIGALGAALEGELQVWFEAEVLAGADLEGDRGLGSLRRRWT